MDLAHRPGPIRRAPRIGLVPLTVLLSRLIPSGSIACGRYGLSPGSQRRTSVPISYPNGGSTGGDPDQVESQFHLEQREFALEARQLRVRFEPFGIRQRIVYQLDQKDVAVVIASKPGQLSDDKIQVITLHTFVAPQIFCSHTAQQRRTS